MGDNGASASTVVRGESQTDSREVTAGNIFFARHGEETDGHLFAGKAVDLGAALLVVEREVDDRVPQIVVADATIALGALATEVVRRVREAGDLTIVGITGSNGKTTTKNLVAAMAERVGTTVASAKSFNNEVGGPLTMLRLEENTRTLVAEMGASAAGEIQRLTSMAPPQIGVVLTVGLAHAGGFGGINSTFEAKSEMVQDLPETAVAVLNRDDGYVGRMAELTRARVRWFGLHPEADVRATDIDADANGTRFTLHADGASLPVSFKVLGEHHVTNALASATVGLELGLTLSQVVEVLEGATRAARWRMEVMGGRDGITIINDAYNASPDSMSAGLKTLAQIKKPTGRTVAVLGAMSELGEYTIEEHLRIALLAVRLRISELVVVGAEARHLHISAINEGSWDGECVFFESRDDAFDYLESSLRPDDTVLVKSSNAAGLNLLGDRLGEAFA
nr:UDP-N-acetylmuramoyl-tripeptide--D-alanyl-D-alanine ligase [Leucobacter exalbidus]